MKSRIYNITYSNALMKVSYNKKPKQITLANTLVINKITL